MTQRQQVNYCRPIVLPSPADSAAIHRVARRIFSRHLNDSHPISWSQAKADAKRAWHEVKQAAGKREVK